ncbi:hypothetical protein IC582_002105 [Cucumis melo]
MCVLITIHLLPHKEILKISTAIFSANTSPSSRIIQRCPSSLVHHESHHKRLSSSPSHIRFFDHLHLVHPPCSDVSISHR